MRLMFRRLLRIIVLVIFIGYYIFLFSAAAYLHFSGSRENQAHKEFREAYESWLLQQKLPWENPEFGELEKEYTDVLRVRMNEAFANRNNAEALNVTSLIKTNLEKKKALLQESRNQLAESGYTIDALFQIAQSLSTSEKRSVALKIASLAEEINSLGQEWIMLMVSDENILERINEFNREFAKGTIDVAQSDKGRGDFQKDSDRMRRSAYQKVLKAERKRNQISREWTRLDSLF